MCGGRRADPSVEGGVSINVIEGGVSINQVSSIRLDRCASRKSNVSRIEGGVPINLISEHDRICPDVPRRALRGCISKVNFHKVYQFLTIFPDKNEQMDPRTNTGYPHEGAAVVQRQALIYVRFDITTLTAALAGLKIPFRFWHLPQVLDSGLVSHTSQEDVEVSPTQRRTSPSIQRMLR